MAGDDRVVILLVDDQPAKLLSYEVILQELGENLIKATSAREALEQMLKGEIAVVLIDVSMPDIDGFELASMIREHPRYEKISIIFVSAIHFSDADRVRGFEKGAVDYVPVPIVPELLRAKVRVFVDLYRKTRELEALNDELERRVRERTAELEAAIERQSILAREVDHRAKNALAVVQSIVRLTRADDIEGYVQAIEGRISALSRAHALLSQSRWEGANLGQLVDEETAPYRTEDEERITTSGLPVLLQPVLAQTLALALHELATNAAKYGALSQSGGRVAIGWELQSGALTLTWVETGGPKVRIPLVRGFGTSLVAASIESQLGGRAAFDWQPTGLSCTLVIPRSEELQLAESSSAAEAKAEDTTEPSSPVSEKVLLVEDEAPVAMMMAGSLRELGFAVLGPFARVAEAAAAARRDEVERAVLDVNLGGEFVYPVADVLAERGVPFIFVTGYGPDRIDGRFASVPVLQKPVQQHDLEVALLTTGG